MQIADVRNAANDCLTIELEHEAKHAVRRGMLGADVDQHVIGRELGLQRLAEARREIGRVATGHERNALRPSLRVETGGRELYFYRAIA